MVINKPTAAKAAALAALGLGGPLPVAAPPAAPRVAVPGSGDLTSPRQPTTPTPPTPPRKIDSSGNRISRPPAVEGPGNTPGQQSYGAGGDYGVGTVPDVFFAKKNGDP